MSPRPLLIALFCALVFGIFAPARAQESRLHAPITALWADSDRLYVGQAETLLIARISPNSLEVERQIALNRGEIRDLYANEHYLFVLTESGLASLDLGGTLIDFVVGGGYHLSLSGDRVYVAALAAGVRLYFVGETGLLVEAGTLQVPGKAFAVQPTQADQIWVAEGENGLKLYEGPHAWGSLPLVTIPDILPVYALSQNAHLLYALNSETLFQVDVSLPRNPRLLNQFPLNPPLVSSPEGSVGSLWTSDTLALIGRFGTEALKVDLTLTSSAISLLGAGEAIAVSGADVFISSSQMGLRRLKLEGVNGNAGHTWEIAASAEICAPSLAQPVDNGTAQSPILLTWQAGCGSTHEVWVNGTLAGVVDTPDPTPTYTFTYHPTVSMVAWQVVTVDSQGGRGESPLWRFEANPDNWTALPVPLPIGDLERPILTTVSPTTLLMLTCAVSMSGLGIIVAAAWWLGVRAQRRSETLL
ncbi:MAG: hypothetical protein IAE83_11230 [Anaerolinea sp.]|nr:hypothetical protein [Anaerolinea sp.]